MDHIVDICDVLKELMDHFNSVTKHLEMALGMETVDSFHNYSEKTLEELEKLIKYIEDNPEKMSAALGRPELKRAQKALGEALTIIEQAVGTLHASWDRKFLGIKIQIARRHLKRD